MSDGTAGNQTEPEVEDDSGEDQTRPLRSLLPASFIVHTHVLRVTSCAPPSHYYILLRVAHTAEVFLIRRVRAALHHSVVPAHTCVNLM